jgi:phosphoribosylaminoimidazolecarboxamide formyltransferase/IMP cyclohydrolase
MKDFEILGGKELSFNNLRDMDLCWKVVNEFKEEMACCAVKHSTPCGVAVGTSALETYTKLLNVTRFLFLVESLE